MRLPIGMTRRALSYDDNMEAPMSTPPHDIRINNLWRRPVIPERKFSHLAEVRRKTIRPRRREEGAELDDDDDVFCFPPGGRERCGESFDGGEEQRPLQVTGCGESQGLLHHHEFSHHQYVTLAR